MSVAATIDAVSDLPVPAVTAPSPARRSARRPAPRRLLAGLRRSLDRSLLRSALMLDALLREKHEGLNRGNADPPASGHR